MEEYCILVFDKNIIEEPCFWNTDYIWKTHKFVGHFRKISKNYNKKSAHYLEPELWVWKVDKNSDYYCNWLSSSNEDAATKDYKHNFKTYNGNSKKSVFDVVDKLRNIFSDKYIFKIARCDILKY